ncbi:MAG: hypothetical protein ABJC09_00080 [Terriglobia bacterium]
MKYIAFAFFVFTLTACTATDEQRTREQAKQTGEVIKKDANEALHEAKAGTEKAGKEIDKGLRDTREKVRRALDATPDNSHK